MDIFNNREIAILLWIAVIVGVLLAKKSGRESLWDLLKATFQYKLVIVYLCMVVYLTSIIYFLFRVEFWDISQLKNTIIWLLTVAFVSLLDINKTDKSNFFRNTVGDVFRFTTVSEFIIHFYTFDLVVEILLIPFVVLIFGMKIVAQKKIEYTRVAASLNKLLILAGIFFIIYAIYKIASNFSSFASVSTLTDFLIPPVLSFLYLPFIYLLAIYVTYTDEFIDLNRRIRNPHLLRYAKWKALVSFNIKRSDFKRWRSLLHQQIIETKKDVDNSLNQIKRLKRIEKNPPVVPFNKGWSPYAAKDFLTEAGLKTRYYQPVYDGEWSASSDYLTLDDELFSNKIAYYVVGTSEVATQLEIVLDVMSPARSVEAHIKMLEIAHVLSLKALGESLPDQIGLAIVGGRDSQVEALGKSISISKDSWPNHIYKGYSLKLIIETCQPHTSKFNNHNHGNQDQGYENDSFPSQIYGVDF